LPKDLDAGPRGEAPSPSNRRKNASIPSWTPCTSFSVRGLRWSDDAFGFPLRYSSSANRSLRKPQTDDFSDPSVFARALRGSACPDDLTSPVIGKG